MSETPRVDAEIQSSELEIVREAIVEAEQYKAVEDAIKFLTGSPNNTVFFDADYKHKIDNGECQVTDLGLANIHALVADGRLLALTSSRNVIDLANLKAR